MAQPRMATNEHSLSGASDGALVRAIVDAGPDALVVLDERGAIVLMNAEAEALFGRRSNDVRGAPIEELVPEAIRAAIARCPAGDSRTIRLGMEANAVALRNDGVEVPVEILLRPLLTARSRYFIASLRDASDRARFERSLREAEERFRRTFDDAPIGMAIVDLDGRFTSVNNAFSAIVGYAAEDLLGRTFQSITHPDDVDAETDLAVRLARGEIARYRLEKRCVTRDGSIVEVALTTSIVRAPDGRALHTITHVEDVTDEKLAAATLKRSEESLARAQRIAHVGNWDWDLRTDVVFRSDELLRIYGVDPDAREVDAKAWSLFDRVHPDDRARVRAEIERALAERRGYVIEHRVARPNGAEREVMQRGEVVLDERGEVARMVGVVLDRTERRRAERERERALRRLETVLTEAPVGIILVLDGGARVVLNERARALLGRERAADDSLDQYTGHIRRADGSIVAREDLPGARALRGEHVDTMELVVVRENGDEVPVLAGAAPIHDDDGRIDGAVVTFEEISAMKRLERLRIEWNSIVAHDLRQPLNAIGLSAKYLSRKAGEDRDAQEASEQILRSTHRLNRMIHDLLDISRLEIRELVLRKKRADVVPIVEACVERAALDAGDRFDVTTHGVMPLVDVDTDRVVQVLENLLSNAVKYAAPETRIAVDVDAVEGAIAVAVTNEGAGIAPEELPKLFQRFHRTEQARRGSVKGIGVGLYIARELVEAHGGTLEATSTPGATTTFRFKLPVVAPS